MESIGQIAAMAGVTPQAIYKRLKAQPELIKMLEPHVSTSGAKRYDATGVKMILDLFKPPEEVENPVENSDSGLNQVENLVEDSGSGLNQVENSVENPGSGLNQVENLDKIPELVEEAAGDQLVAQLRDEINFLREQLLFEQERLTIAEGRGHELAMRLADLVESNRNLTLQLATKKDEEMEEGQPNQPNLWQRFRSRYLNK
jgi:hypothetical protein